MIRFNLIIFLFITACNKHSNFSHLNAAFTVSNEEVSIIEVVKFQSLNFDAIRHEWDFGDGTTSTVHNPTHLFPENGEYIVKHTTFSNEGKVASNSKIIKVYSIFLDKIELKKSNNPYYGFSLRLFNAYHDALFYYNFLDYDSTNHTYFKDSLSLPFMVDSTYQFIYGDFTNGNGGGNSYEYFYVNQFRPYSSEISENLTFFNKDPNTDFEILLRFEKVIYD